MARVKSFLGLQGSVGETTFRKVKGKYYAYDKIIVSPGKRKKHDDFASARKNAAEFKSGVNAGALLRSSISLLLHKSRDTNMVNNLNQLMMKILRIDYNKYDTEPAKLLPGNMQFLAGHNFNKKVTLRSVFNTRYKTTINRTTGELTISIPSFNPANCITPAKFATHFRLVSSGVEIDFKNKKQKSTTYRSEEMKIDDTPTMALTIKHQLTPGTEQILLIVLGILFIDESKIHYSAEVEMRKVNPLCIVDISSH